MQNLSHQFLNFCRSKPADETFEYFDARSCAFYQFAVEIGLPDPVRKGGDIPPPMGTILPMLATEATERGQRPTFGALADRLEKALAERVSA